MSNFWNRLLVLSGFLLSTSVLFAQTTTGPTSNSPYSRLGLGDLIDQNFAASAGMGGLSASYHDPYHLNILNPASYGWLRSTAFEVGMNSEYTLLSDGENDTNVWDGGLNYMAIGFPMRNPINETLDRREKKFGWGMGVALTPYSKVGYDIESISSIPDTITSSFQGNGGTYKINWGTGVRYKNLSVGLSLGYFFGRIDNQRLSFLEDTDNTSSYYYNDFIDGISVSGVTWSGGIMYDWVFKSQNDKGALVANGKKITIGLHGNAAQEFNTTTSKLYRRLYSVTLGDLARDTITNIQDEKGIGKLPSELSFGFQYQDENKLRVGFNYTLANWSEYVNPSQSLALSNGSKASVGLEYTPDYASYNKYLKRVRYRIGAFYSNDPRSFQGEQLQHYAITLGMGMPVVLPRQQTSFVNIALEAGQFGLQEAINETYVKLTLGFTLNDNTWFFKRKFN